MKIKLFSVECICSERENAFNNTRLRRATTIWWCTEISIYFQRANKHWSVYGIHTAVYIKRISILLTFRSINFIDFCTPRSLSYNQHVERQNGSIERIKYHKDVRSFAHSMSLNSCLCCCCYWYKIY